MFSQIIYLSISKFPTIFPTTLSLSHFTLSLFQMHTCTLKHFWETTLTLTYILRNTYFLFFCILEMIVEQRKRSFMEMFTFVYVVVVVIVKAASSNQVIRFHLKFWFWFENFKKIQKRNKENTVITNILALSHRKHSLCICAHWCLPLNCLYNSNTL